MLTVTSFARCISELDRATMSSIIFVMYGGLSTTRCPTRSCAKKEPNGASVSAKALQYGTRTLLASARTSYAKTVAPVIHQCWPRGINILHTSSLLAVGDSREQNRGVDIARLVYLDTRVRIDLDPFFDALAYARDKPHSGITPLQLLFDYLADTFRVSVETFMMKYGITTPPLVHHGGKVSFKYVLRLVLLLFRRLYSLSINRHWARLQILRSVSLLQIRHVRAKGPMGTRPSLVESCD